MSAAEPKNLEDLCDEISDALIGIVGEGTDDLPDSERVEVRVGSRHVSIVTLGEFRTAHNLAAIAQVAADDRADLIERARKLQAFKERVHKWLDDAGIPSDPPGPLRDQGCRVGQRLHTLGQRIDDLERALAGMLSVAVLDPGHVHTIAKTTDGRQVLGVPDGVPASVWFDRRERAKSRS